MRMRNLNFLCGTGCCAMDELLRDQETAKRCLRNEDEVVYILQLYVVF